MKSARLIVVTKEDFSAYSGRIGKTLGSPEGLQRHKSELLPYGLKKSLSVNSAKFRLLMKEDEELLADPPKLERQLSSMLPKMQSSISEIHAVAK